MTRPQRRRSGDGVRGGRRDELLPGGRGDGPHPPVGIERPRDAPDLLPPRAEGRAPRRASSTSSIRGAPARRSGPTAGSGLDVGSDIALANAMAREIIARGPREPDLHRARHHRLRGVPRDASSATRSSTPSAITGVPEDAHPRGGARLRARRPGRDLLDARASPSTTTRSTTSSRSSTSRCSPATSAATARASTRCAARTTCRAAATWARIPNKLPGFQDVEDDAVRAKFEAAWGVPMPPKRGWHLTADVRGHGARRAAALYVIGENPASRRPTSTARCALLEGLEHLVVQDIFLTTTAEMADVVLPAAASWCESEGTVTNSERRVQRVRKALEPPGEARDDIEILCELARRLGHDWGEPDGRGGLERAALALADARRHELRAARGARRAAVAVLRREPSRASRSCTAGSGRSRCAGRGRRSRPWSTSRRSTRSTRSSRCASPPAAGSTRTTPACRPAATRSPLRRGETLDLSPEDAQRFGLREGERGAGALAARRGRGAGAPRSRRCGRASRS